MKKLVLAITALMSWTIGINSFGQCSADQSFLGGDNRAASITSSGTVGQSFKANQSGGLHNVSLSISTENAGCTLGTVDLNIEILEVTQENPLIGNILASQVFSVSSNLAQSLEEFTFNNQAQITAGKFYVIQASLVAGQECGGNEPNLNWYFAFPTSYWNSTGGIQYFGTAIPSLGNTQKFATCIGEYTPPESATHLNFDGSNDLVSFGNGISTHLTGKSALTIEAMVRPETKSGTAGGFGVIAGNYNYPTTTGSHQFLLRRDGDSYIFGINHGSSPSPSEYVLATDAVKYNEWQHVAGVYDGDSLSLYINGELIERKATTGALFNDISNDFVIGNNTIGESFDGDIDEVRVWDVALSQVDIKRKYKTELEGDENGLLAYYQLNEGIPNGNNASVTTVTDITGNGYDGTLINLTLDGTSSNWVKNSVIITDSRAPMAPTVDVQTINYLKDETASPLNATTNGVSLMWYTSKNSLMGTDQTPTPSTDAVGSTSYWVSSFNMEGSESERVEIVVTIVEKATHLNFDGSNDLVSFGNGISTYFNGKSVATIEATVRAETKSGTNNYGVIAGNYDSNGNGELHFLLRRDNDEYLFFVNSGGINIPINSGNAVIYNEWQHVAGVWDGDTAYLFVDGELKNKKAVTGAFRTLTNKFVAGTNGINEAFDGDIEEIRVWDIALSHFDIKRQAKCELNGDENGLVAYYQFNQGGNDTDNSLVTTVTDLTGNGYNGTLTNFDLTGMSSNWKTGSDIETGSMIPGTPSTTELVSYSKNDVSLPLEATTNAPEVMWYTTAPSIMGDLNAPTPSTIEDGTFEYWVSSFEMEGCESEKVKITVEVSPVLGTVNASANALTIYPNPTTSYINIEVNETSTVSVYNMQGFEVLHKTIEAGRSTINRLPSGTYSIIVTDSTTRKSETIIVE